MSDYWFLSSDNPFNRMEYTRGGGGKDNDQTRESNQRRADAMPKGSIGAVPHYASTMVAGRQMDGPGLAFIDGELGYVGRSVSGPGTSRQVTGDEAGTGTAGPGAAGASNAQQPAAVPGAGAKPSFGVGAGGIGYTLGPKTGPGSKKKLPDTFSGDEQRSVPVPFGGDQVLIVEPDERFPDVEDWWEPRYGEPGEWIGGGVNIMVDAVKNLEGAVGSSVTVRPGSAADAVVRNLPTVIDGVKGGPVDDADLPNPMSYAPMSGW